MLEQHRPPFGDRVVSEPALLHRKVRRGVREVLGVSGFVEERPPVVGAADRLDHEHHLVGDLDRRAESTGRLRGPLLDVEMDVLLRVQVDAEIGERRLERGQHFVGWEELVPDLGAEDAWHVPALRVVEADADPVPEELVGGVLVHLLGRVEHRPALGGEVVEPVSEAAVEVDVRGRAQLRNRPLADLDCVEVDGVEVLVRQGRPRLVEAFALVPVLRVRDRRPQHPEADLLAVHLGLELGLEGGDLLAVLLRQVAEMALAGEAPQLPDSPVSVDRLAERLRPFELGQILVAFVDRLELELVLEAGEMEVVLLVELGDEAIGVVAVRVEVLRRGRRVRHRP